MICENMICEKGNFSGTEMMVFVGGGSKEHVMNPLINIIRSQCKKSTRPCIHHAALCTCVTAVLTANTLTFSPRYTSENRHFIAEQYLLI